MQSMRMIFHFPFLMAVKINQIALFACVLGGMAVGTTIVNRWLKPDMVYISFHALVYAYKTVNFTFSFFSILRQKTFSL